MTPNYTYETHAAKAGEHLEGARSVEALLSELYAQPAGNPQRAARLGEAHHLQRLAVKFAEVEALLAIAAAVKGHAMSWDYRDKFETTNAHPDDFEALTKAQLGELLGMSAAEVKKVKHAELVELASTREVAP